MSTRSSAPAARAPRSARRALASLRVCLAVAATLAAAPLQAQSGGTPLRFDAVNGTNAFGYYVGPNTGTLFRPGAAMSLTLFCVDFLNHVAVGQQRPVNVTSLASSNLDDTRHPGQLEDYRKAAWLTTRFDPAHQEQWGGIQAAIWQIMTPGNPDGGTDAANQVHEAYWLQQANLFAASAGYSTYDWSRFYVLTDVAAAGQGAGVGMQEFITSSPNVVPEPETWALLAGGLVVIGVIGWRRRRA